MPEPHFGPSPELLSTERNEAQNNNVDTGRRRGSSDGREMSQ